MPEGRQSPPPEAQSGKQQQDAPGSGKGVSDVNPGEKKNQQEDQLKVRFISKLPSSQCNQTDS